MCSIPDPPPPPDVVANPSEVGKSAAGAVAAPTADKKKQQGDNSFLASMQRMFTPLVGGTSSQTNVNKAVSGLVRPV